MTKRTIIELLEKLQLALPKAERIQNTFYRLSEKLTISSPKVPLYIPPKKKRKDP